ncbi:MAG TPA: TfoX/Sxy family protein [Anaerolineales bacterium]|nr:TfoX/Sxy family protein [Anaerolineales bacterium]
MAYDLKLAERIRTRLESMPVVEKKMFGGVGFVLNGNLACGVNKDNLIVRVDPKKHVAFLKKPHVRPFDMQAGRCKAGSSSRQMDTRLISNLARGLRKASTLPQPCHQNK